MVGILFFKCSVHFIYLALLTVDIVTMQIHKSSTVLV